MAVGRKVVPWKSANSETEQIRFIQRWESGGETFLELCQSFGISRKTGYKRVHRFQVWGWDGLGDLSRAPHQHPNQTERAVAERLIAARQSHPTWGPKKLVAWLKDREPSPDANRGWPAPSTVGDLLDRAGLVRRRKGRRRAAPWSQPFVQAEQPNDLWCIDFKGWFRTGDGVRVNPLTVEDASSRYLLACHGLRQPRGPQVRPVLERAFQEYGLPWAIRTDNGPPFASVGLGSLSSLAVWWVKLGIIPERIEPGHPEQNGRLERLHRTLKAETASPPQPTWRRQQRAFQSFRSNYNEERPHEALGQQPPARRYRSSVRPYPRRVDSPEYESGTTVRRVRTNGEIKWQGGTVYLSEALCGEPVGLTPQDDRFWTIRYGPIQIGLLDSYALRTLHTPTLVLPMSPVYV